MGGVNPAMRYCIPCRRLVRLEQWVDHSLYHQIKRRIFGPLRVRRGLASAVGAAPSRAGAVAALDTRPKEVVPRHNLIRLG